MNDDAPNANSEDSSQTDVPLGAAGAGAEGPRAWRRIKAGLLVEAGRADRKVAAAWQKKVIAGEWSADAAAQELLGQGPPVPDSDDGLEQRSARLMRDLVMSPKLKGAAGAARSARKAGRNFFAYILTQLMVLVVFAVILAAGLIVARWRGVAVDPLLDTVVQYLPEAPADRTASDPGDAE